MPDGSTSQNLSLGDWLAGWLVGRLAGWPVGRLAGWNVNKGKVCERVDPDMYPSTSHGHTGTLVKQKEIVQPTSAKTEDVFDVLPNEIWLKIFRKLSHRNLLHISLVCRHWCQLAHAVLKRKSQLIVTSKNVESICELLKRRDLKFRNVEIRGWMTEKSLQLNNVTQVSLLKTFQYLGSDIARLTLYQPSVLSLLNNLLPKLTNLDLCDMCFEENVSLDFSKFSNLKSLSAPSNKLATGQLLSNLTQTPTPTTTHLQKLSINISDSFADGLRVIATSASSLRWLTVGSCGPLRSESQIKETFKKLTHLKVLDLSGICCETLEALNAKRAILENLSKDNPLKTLNLGSMPVDYYTLELIITKWSRSLQCLYLPCTALTGIFIKQINFTRSKLRRLVLRGFFFPDVLNGIAPKTNKTLTELKLFDCRLTTESFCTLMERLPNLRILDVRGLKTKLTDKEMFYIFEHLIHLRRLFLDPCVSENCITDLKPNISKLKRLEILESCVCPIKVLQLLGMEVKFKQLTTLDLKCCKRSDKLSVKTILDISVYFPVLESLLFQDLSRCSSVQELRRKLPRLILLDYDIFFQIESFRKQTKLSKTM
uniref:F-box domain-containing protein n=1 Tax=Glossina austeni TaxID=7395 RepID=A0A1A9V809_GLOAU